MEAKVTKTKTQQCIHILQTTRSFNVPQVIKTLQEGLWRRHKVPLASPTLAVTNPLGTTFNCTVFMTQKLLST